MLNVSASPHVRDNITTAGIMRGVFLSLLPALIPAYIYFGHRAITLTAVTVLAAMGFEYLWCLMFKMPNSVPDFSAAVTGLLLAYNLPPGFSYGLAVLGAFIAVIVCKMFFGGLGKNITNPAITARVIMLVSFAGPMTDFAKLKKAGSQGLDLVSSPTPLGLLKENAPDLPSYWQLFLGNKAGTIGEISIAALLIGAAWLLATQIIRPWIPLSFIGTTLLIVTLAGQNPLYHLLTGGLVLGAFFMATDYVTSPPSNSGQLVFGMGCGIITALIRLYSNSAEGVSYSILLMNIINPHICNRFNEIPIGVKALRTKQKAEAAAAKAAEAEAETAEDSAGQPENLKASLAASSAKTKDSGEKGGSDEKA